VKIIYDGVGEEPDYIVRNLAPGFLEKDLFGQQKLLTG